MKSLLPILLFLSFANHLNAQILSGTVYGENGKPIENVNIFVKGTEKHAHTNAVGFFEISTVSVNDTLLFSHVAFEELTILASNAENPLRIVLHEKEIGLSDIVITDGIDALCLITKLDLQTAPVNNSQEVLRKVPGLFIGQHAGGGKAEQIFLRGFDIDHGTDISINVDGMPVNMVSHAHGQGYADLHFIIPETIDKINFGKGPSFAEQGNFSTAGYVDFKTKNRLDEGLIKLEAGQFNSSRLLSMFNVLSTEQSNAFVALDVIGSDGPFDSPQNFSRNNVMAKYSSNLPSGQISAQISRFTSKWDASGQIPERAVADGSIGRFGAIDNTEGGKTSRTNFILDWTKQASDNVIIKNSAYLAFYDFELFSNFTFFLDDSLNGDQIKQKESRQLFGFKSEIKQYFEKNNWKGSLAAAIGLRNDQTTDSELSHTLQRQTTLSQMQLGDIAESNYFGFVNAEFQIGKWLFNPAMRIDYFVNAYYDKLQSTYSNQSASAAILSPKLNVLYNYSNHLQLYLKTGRGFHSNDTRVVVPQNGKSILPAAHGADLGFIWKPYSRLMINAACWYLFLQQEFVYVGDAGIVELSGQSARKGIDIGLRYEITHWLYADADVNSAIARSVNEESGNNYIPLAPALTATGGLSIVHPSGFYGGVRCRVMTDRPANEDNSIVARGYNVTDLNAGYKFKRMDIGIKVENVFDVKWNETQFATESRLQTESESVEEIHFTPGTPFFLKGSLAYRF